MSRYIEVELLLNHFNGEGRYHVAKRIAHMAKKNGVEIVNCKECERYCTNELGTWCLAALRATDPEGFCHQGICRKEEQ